MFEYVRKFEIIFGRQIFEDVQDIFKVEVEQEYDNREGESAVHLTHRNGLRMSVIHCSNTEPDCIRVLVQRINFNFEDWNNLHDAAEMLLNKNAKNNSIYQKKTGVWFA